MRTGTKSVNTPIILSYSGSSIPHSGEYWNLSNEIWKGQSIGITRVNYRGKEIESEKGQS